MIFNLENNLMCKIDVCLRREEQRQLPDFLKDISFHVSFHVKFGYMGCCDFSINSPQKHMFGYVTFNVKYYILSQIFYKKIG